MNTEEKFNLIKKDTEEILTNQDLKTLLKEKTHPQAYIGMAPTGPFHMAYLIPLGKMIDFEKTGIKNIILVADIHAALDDLKCPWEQLEKRSAYYQKCIELGFPWKTKPKFVKGSTYQLKSNYALDVLKLSTLTTVARATRAASEVTRMKNPKVSELIYPLMQSLDEQYLGVDIQLGGIDQRHILAYAREYLPKIGYQPRIEIMTPLIASLKGPGTKMSASIPMSHIKVYDSEALIKEKIKQAYCPEADIKENSIIQLCRYLIFPIKEKMTIERPAKFGGDITYPSYATLEKDFLTKKLHPLDLKKALTTYLIAIFSKVRKYFEKHHNQLEELGPTFLPEYKA